MVYAHDAISTLFHVMRVACQAVKMQTSISMMLPIAWVFQGRWGVVEAEWDEDESGRVKFPGSLCIGQRVDQGRKELQWCVTWWLLRPLLHCLASRGVGLGEEDVGLIGVTYNSEWIELVPWNSELEWDVDPWGRW
eukprot:scaffold32747_cov21-Tisochrysis_lutea.AAC.1